MDAKKRMYYFDGKNILLDTYDERGFDQVFEDSKNPKLAQSITIDQKEKDNKIISDRSMSQLQGQNQNNISLDQFKESKIDSYSPKLLPREVFLNIKDQYYKTKGYIENRPDILFEFFLEFKGFERVTYTITSATTKNTSKNSTYHAL